MAKRWFIDLPPANPTPDQEWNQANPQEGFKRRKDAVEHADKTYGSVKGKLDLVSSDGQPKRWFVDVPSPISDEWLSTGEADGWKRRKDAVEYVTVNYGGAAGKIQIVTTAEV
jgi:hypothetical protein